MHWFTQDKLLYAYFEAYVIGFFTDKDLSGE